MTQTSQQLSIDKILFFFIYTTYVSIKDDNLIESFQKVEIEFIWNWYNTVLNDQ